MQTKMNGATPPTPALDRVQPALDKFLDRRKARALGGTAPTPPAAPPTVPADKPTKVAKPAETPKGEKKSPAKGKTPAAPKTKPARAQAAKAAAKKPATKTAKTSRTGYDWEKATAGAAEGKVPPLPPFASYQPHLRDVCGMAKTKDVSGIKAYLKTFKDEQGGRANLFKYARLCIEALGK